MQKLFMHSTPFLMFHFLLFSFKKNSFPPLRPPVPPFCFQALSRSFVFFPAFSRRNFWTGKKQHGRFQLGFCDPFIDVIRQHQWVFLSKKQQYDFSFCQHRNVDKWTPTTREPFVLGKQWKTFRCLSTCGQKQLEFIEKSGTDKKVRFNWITALHNV